MKRLIFYTFLISLIFSLCGCDATSEIADSSSSYLVSALGFEEREGKLNVLVETMVINSEDPEAEKKRTILMGSGENAQTALNDAKRKAARPLELKHSGAVIISESVGKKYFKDICDFCYKGDELTLSVLFAATDSAEKLLAVEPSSTIAIGYEIMSIIEQQSALSGINQNNRFYEIEALRQKPVNVIFMPNLKVDNDTFTIDGARVYKDDSFVFTLSEEELFLLAVATDNQGKGETVLKNRVTEIKDCYSKINPKTEEQAELVIDLDLEKTEYKTDVKEKISRLFSLSKQYDTDIFGIGNSFYNKNKDLWRKIKNEYSKFYKNLELTVKIK